MWLTLVLCQLSPDDFYKVFTLCSFFVQAEVKKGLHDCNDTSASSDALPSLIIQTGLVCVVMVFSLQLASR